MGVYIKFQEYVGEDTMSFCSSCGMSIKNDSKFCSNCGSKLNADDEHTDDEQIQNTIVSKRKSNLHISKANAKARGSSTVTRVSTKTLLLIQDLSHKTNRSGSEIIERAIKNYLKQENKFYDDFRQIIIKDLIELDPRLEEVGDLFRIICQKVVENKVTVKQVVDMLLEDVRQIK